MATNEGLILSVVGCCSYDARSNVTVCDPGSHLQKKVVPGDCELVFWEMSHFTIN